MRACSRYISADYKGRSYFTLHYARTYGEKIILLPWESDDKFTMWSRHVYPRTKSRAVTSPMGVASYDVTVHLRWGVSMTSCFANQTFTSATKRTVYLGPCIVLSPRHRIGYEIYDNQCIWYIRCIEYVQFPFVQERILSSLEVLKENVLTISNNSRSAFYVDHFRDFPTMYKMRKLLIMKKRKGEKWKSFSSFNLTQTAKTEVFNLI